MASATPGSPGPTKTELSRIFVASAVISSTPPSPRTASALSSAPGTAHRFRSIVDAVRCAIEVQNGLIERNAGLPPEKRIEFHVGVHVGDVVEEATAT
jgi:class 3 adenylate cyclase